MTVFKSPRQQQQYYPTYKIGGIEIGLAEYEATARVVEAEERLFVFTSNVILILSSAAGYVGLSSLVSLLKGEIKWEHERLILFCLLAFICMTAILALRYIGERQRGVTFAKRKIVVLRTIMGIDYGGLQMVLPNWRIEGAQQPFAIKMFPGWFSFVAFPFQIIASISALLVWFITATYISFEAAADTILPEAAILSAVVALAWVVLLALFFRSALFDTHENWWIAFARMNASTSRVKVVPDAEYVVYRAKLAVEEIRRLNIDLRTLRSIAVQIEDKEFYKHVGISFRGITRGIYSVVSKNRRRSGGSTITQQLARTLFLTNYSPLIDRKIMEAVLAFWLESRFPKQEILDMYLASVRFASGANGLMAGMDHYFGKSNESPSAAVSFFLVERLSNYGPSVRPNVIHSLIESCVRSGEIDAIDAKEIVCIYAEQVRKGVLTPTDEASFSRLKHAWRVQEI